MAIRLRKPALGELPFLTALILRSKAVHGYDAAFMAACRDELALVEGACDLNGIRVAERDGEILGVVEVVAEAGIHYLEKLFVEPGVIGRGVGRRLFHWAVAAARSAGAAELTIEADPGAEGFYLAMGAARCGERASASIPGRALPLLKIALE